jgi:Homeobox KN domain/Mating-type protein beta 1
MPTSSENLDLEESLRSVREDFLNAIANGSTSLSIFHKSWAGLREQIENAQTTCSLDEKTLSLANTVARDVAVISQSFLDVEVVASSCASRLELEWQGLIGSGCQPVCDNTSVGGTSQFRSPKPSLQPPRHPTTNSPPFAAILASRKSPSDLSITEFSRSTSEPNPLPEFIEHAYKFFVTNIFNPYPTRQEKQAIVDKTNNSDITLATISNWFTNSRRRCGWTDILRRRFDNNRDEMVNLAIRVFVKPDPHRPVDPKVISEFMNMKKNVESLYERKTRTSAWIDELAGMEELINPIPPAVKKRETEAEREARKRQRELQKEQRDLERRKQKMQAEALRKAEKVARQIRREQEQGTRRKGRASNIPTQQVDEQPITETSTRAAGGKRKHLPDVGSSYDFSEPRHVSPVDSDVSSDSRVPSLSWSDSGEERPYKRSRYDIPASSEVSFTHLSNPRSFTPSTHTSGTPALEVPTSFEYSFTFEPPTDTQAMFNSLLGFSNTSESSVASPQVPSRGQKRGSDTEDGEETPRLKRTKPIVASGGPELAPEPSTPLFTPTPSVDGTSAQAASRRSSLAPVDFEAFLGLNQTNPPQVENSEQSTQPVQDFQREQSLQQLESQPEVPFPFEIDFGSFDWSAYPDSTVDTLGPSEEYTPADFAQLLQSVTEQLPPSQVEPYGQVEHRVDSQPEVSPFDWLTSDPLLQQPGPATGSASQQEENIASDLSGLMSGLMSEQAFKDLGLAYPEVTYPTVPDLSHSSSGTPAWTPTPTTPPSEAVPTPAELAEKALSKERKRKELEEKKAALERERARLAEIERELEEE